MIAARAQALTALVERRALLREHVDKLDAFQGREQKLQALLQTLRPLTEAAGELRQHGIAEINVQDRLPGVLSQLHRTETVYREERDSFVDAQRSGFADFERTLGAFFTSLEDQIREAWRAHTQDRVRPLDPEVLEVLGSIPAYSETTLRLKSLERRVNELRDALPSESVCDQFEAATADRNQLWEEMQGTDFSREILNFLRRASGGGASLDDYTPEVDRWIAGHDLQASFRITMAPRVSG